MEDQEILDIKKQIEEHLKAMDMLSKCLVAAGYNIQACPGNKVYIYKTSVKEFGDRPPRPDNVRSITPPDAA